MNPQILSLEFLKKLFTINFYIMRKLFLLALLSFGLYSCSNEEVDPMTALDGQVANRIDTDCATILDLKAGQNFVAGTVTVTNNDFNVYVTYQTSNEWELNEVHLYVGPKAGIPINPNGSPKIGQFPINVTNLYQKTYTVAIPITWTDECFVIAAHAVVTKTDGTSYQTETAWSEGPRFKNNAWAMYSEICLKDCIPDCDYTNETAYGGSLLGGGNAWWYYYSNDGTQQPIYAGKVLVDGAYVQYNNGQLLIELGPNMELTPVSEAVKIQGYDVLPLTRPASGLFTTYKGTSLTPTVGTFAYYVIHLDVKISTCTTAE
jgi:hypothetical protein